MIQTQTYLNVANNSGVRKLMRIGVLKASNQKYVHIGDVIIVVVKEAILNMPLKKLEVVKAIVVCICKEFKHKNGTSVQFNDNDVIVINQEGNPKGTHFLV
jgi:large subunit ribosomal protein L14